MQVAPRDVRSVSILTSAPCAHQIQWTILKFRQPTSTVNVLCTRFSIKPNPCAEVSRRSLKIGCLSECETCSTYYSCDLFKVCPHEGQTMDANGVCDWTCASGSNVAGSCTGNYSYLILYSMLRCQLWSVWHLTFRHCRRLLQMCHWICPRSDRLPVQICLPSHHIRNHDFDHSHVARHRYHILPTLCRRSHRHLWVLDWLRGTFPCWVRY